VDFGGRGRGVLFHSASATGDGILVVDVYESCEAATGSPGTGSARPASSSA